MSAANSYQQEYFVRENSGHESRAASKNKPMVADPVKLHLATWMVSVSTAVIAMWAASFVLIGSQSDHKRVRIQDDIGRRVEILEAEMKEVHLINSRMMLDARNALEREVNREIDRGGQQRQDGGERAGG